MGAEGLDRINVQNNPINLIDPYGLFEIALTPYAVAVAPAIAMLDSPLLPFADAAAGALIGIAYLHDRIEDMSDEELEDLYGDACEQGGFEKMPQGDNTRHKDEFDDAVSQLEKDLNKNIANTDLQQQLHREISNKGVQGYKGIYDAGIQLFGK